MRYRLARSSCSPYCSPLPRRAAGPVSHLRSHLVAPAHPRSALARPPAGEPVLAPLCLSINSRVGLRLPAEFSFSGTSERPFGFTDSSPSQRDLGSGVPPPPRRSSCPSSPRGRARNPVIDLARCPFFAVPISSWMGRSSPDFHRAVDLAPMSCRASVPSAPLPYLCCEVYAPCSPHPRCGTTNTSL